MDDLGNLIASLAQDASWADDLSVPTPAQIRARVAAFTPERRAAARLDGERAESTPPWPW